jgi:uncharacterized membrane protein YjgN (DUF898 family)
MDNSTQSTHKYSLSFEGSASKFFEVIVINWLLTIVTLGFYYPWARARKFQFLYSATEFNESPFTFHGTGKEMFMGFLKAIGFFILLYALSFTLIYLRMPIVGIISLYVGILTIIPFAMHGSYSYRMSRTSWRGIRFSYRGDRKELYILFFKSILFTLLTFGFYGAWMVINLRNYILSNIKFGNLKFKYSANGGEYFMLNLKGYFLSIVTLGIYSFWWMKDLYAYYINHLTLENGADKIRFRSTASAGGIFSLILGNVVIIVFTLGLGYAWVITRSFTFLFENIEMVGSVNVDQIVQDYKSGTDATGEDLSDMLDVGFIV